MKKQDLIFDISKSVILALILTFILANITLANEPDSPAGTPTRLLIPTIALDREVFPVGWTPIVVNGTLVGQWETLDNHVAWHNFSAGLGQVGNTVLNGHSDIHTRVFRNLPDVEIGDEIIAFSGERMFRYVVTSKILVREKGVSHEQRAENAKLIAPTNDERLTLVTCAAPAATHRLIIIAQPGSPR